MFCKNCGHLNDNESLFCSGCGKPLSAVDTTTVIDEQVNNAGGQTESLSGLPVPGRTTPDAPLGTFEQQVFSKSAPNVPAQYNDMPKAPEPALKRKEKKKSTLPLILTIVLVLVLGGAAATVFGASALDTKKYDELIDTGNKYLEELKYEDAVETYLEAIDIKPKREEAYVGAATGYVKLDKPEKAKEILEQGLENIKKPGDEFMELCGELGVEDEIAKTESEPSRMVVQKQYTADDIEELSKYLYSKGCDQIDWDNMDQTLAKELFFAAAEFNDMQNLLVEGTELYEALYDTYDGCKAFSLTDVNKNIKSLFGDNSRPLTRNNFFLYEGPNSNTNGQQGPVFVFYYQDLDWVLVAEGAYGSEEWPLDYIIDSIPQGDTIVIRQQNFIIEHMDELDMIPYTEPSGFLWGTASFAEKQKVVKGYYDAAKSAGIDVDDYILVYTLAFNADGTIYLKSVCKV